MFYPTVICVLGIFICTASGACEDNVSKSTAITVLNNQGKEIGKAKSCSMLLKKWPSLCEKTSGDLVIGGNGGRCCKTCGNPKCLDKIGTNSNFLVGDKKIKSCKQMVKKFPGLCKEEGKKGGKCCRSCQGVDTSCVDDPLKLFTSEVLTCAQVIKKDPCMCDTNGDDCCASCKNVDTGALGCDCRDTLTKDKRATIAITDPTNNNKPVVSKDVDNCKEIVEYFAQFCAPGDLGKSGCCESCKDVDPTCKDNLLWKGSVTAGGKSCNNCNCHEIMRKSKKLMRKACKNNIKADRGSHRIRADCCLQCSRVGFSPK